jgi:hypothetical protein
LQDAWSLEQCLCKMPKAWNSVYQYVNSVLYHASYQFLKANM